VSTSTSTSELALDLVGGDEADEEFLLDCEEV
jgi:hypothetical protein